jgi:hypothetical protein
MLANPNLMCPNSMRLLRDEPRVTSDCEITMGDLQPLMTMAAYGFSNAP